jgi:hypothetical protein
MNMDVVIEPVRLGPGGLKPHVLVILAEIITAAMASFSPFWEHQLGA